MTVKDLIEIIENKNEYNLKDTYDDIMEMIEELKNNCDDVIHDLELGADVFCENNELCRYCGTKLEYNLYNEIQGEYMGSEAEELTDNTYCPNGCIQE